jgi:hypothetical protein
MILAKHVYESHARNLLSIILHAYPGREVEKLHNDGKDREVSFVKLQPEQTCDKQCVEPP